MLSTRNYPFRKQSKIEAKKSAEAEIMLFA